MRHLLTFSTLISSDMKFAACWPLFLTTILQVSCKITLEEQFNAVSRKARYLVYPDGSGIGMLLAYAIPLELQEQNVLFSYNVEANYNLPTDAENFHFTPLVRSFMNFNRTFLYDFIEKKIDSMGSNGHDCLLQLICDIAKTPVTHNGLVGDLLQVLFMPSTSEDEGLTDEEEAEERGKDGETDCQAYYSNCPHSILDAISYFTD